MQGRGERFTQKPVVIAEDESHGPPNGHPRKPDVRRLRATTSWQRLSAQASERSTGILEWVSGAWSPAEELGGRGTVCNLKLPHDRGDVRPDRACRKHQPVRDLRGGAPL